MFGFSVFSWGPGWEPKICTSRFHNYSYGIPIYKWDTSLNLWLNSLTFYIQIYFLGEGRKFNPFSYSIFPNFQWGPEWAPKICTSRFHNLSYWTPIYKWDTSLNLWMNSLIFCIKIYLESEGRNFNPFSYSYILVKTIPEVFGE